jgi:hypothetical protein
LPGDAEIHHYHDMKILLSRAWIWPIALGILGSAAAALWIGFQDVAWPVSLSAQTLGVFFVIAGLSGLVSAGVLLVKALPFARWAATGSVQLAFISGGAVAALYVDLTIVAYSFRYQPGRASLFGVLALSCAYLVWLTLPPAWKDISKGMKNTGITLAALSIAANFWFQSFYLPANAQAGIEYGLSVGPVVKSGKNTLVTIYLTLSNHSPVDTELVINSMVAVSGLDYENHQKAKVISDAEAQRRAYSYAASLTGRSSGKSAAVPNPNVRFDGTLKSTALTILQPVNSDSYLFPDDTYSRDFDVVIPSRRIGALDVKL